MRHAAVRKSAAHEKRNLRFICLFIGLYCKTLLHCHAAVYA